jgi:hypothetical protein
MRTTLLPLLLITSCLVVPVLPAQDDSTQPRNWRKAQVRAQVEEMRKAMREGRIRRYNVKVKVRLKNGNKIQGIVRNGRFIEKHDGLDFVVTDQRSEQAGLRLWYYNGTNSYIFLPHAMIAHYKLGVKMSDREITDLERRLVAAERRRREMERQLAEERRRRLLAMKANRGDKLSKLDDDATKYGRKLTDDERKLMKLLGDYPPDKGWGEQKIKELQMRRITLGVYPSKEEKLFVEQFEEWKRAVSLKEKLDRQRPSVTRVTGDSGQAPPSK